MKLYIYDHCPYCVKARMIFGLKNIDFHLVTLQNDDEKTPTSMIGTKMVPILEKDDGSFIPESMDIVYYIDNNYGEKILNSYNENQDLAEWLIESRSYLYRLCMPRWAKAKLEEFKSKSAIDYFTKKKESMIGSFEENLAISAELIKQAEFSLDKLEKLIEAKGDKGEFTEDDIHLFAALRSLTIVKGLKFPEKVAEYTDKLSKSSKIPLHWDLAI